MKILFAASLMLFLSLNTFCQHTQISFSEDFKFAEDGYKNQTVSHSVYLKDNFYTGTNSGAGMGKWLFTKLYDVKFTVTISKFDRNMNKIKEMALENGAKTFGPLMPELLLLNDNLFLAYFQSDNKTSFNFYLARVDENDLTLKETKKICTIQQENVGIFKVESIINGNLVSFCNSPDNKNVLLACKASPNTMQTFVLNDHLDILKQSTIPVNTTTFDVSSAVLTNDNLECLVLRGDQETKIIYISPDGKKAVKSLRGTANLNPGSTMYLTDML